jgi:hypothetical protein
VGIKHAWAGHGTRTLCRTRHIQGSARFTGKPTSAQHLFATPTHSIFPAVVIVAAVVCVPELECAGLEADVGQRLVGWEHTPRCAGQPCSSRLLRCVSTFTVPANVAAVFADSRCSGSILVVNVLYPLVQGYSHVAVLHPSKKMHKQAKREFVTANDVPHK